MRSFLSLSHVLSGALGGLVVAGGLLSYLLCNAEPTTDEPDPQVVEMMELTARVSALETRVEAEEAEKERRAELRRERMAERGEAGEAEDDPPSPPPFPPETVRCADEDHCTMDRLVVEMLLGEPTVLMKQARIMPSVKDGVTRGFKMYGLRPGSLLKLLGYKNGDLITAVNGMPLLTLDGAMEVYTNLRHATELKVSVERKGETLTKVLKIAP